MNTSSISRAAVSEIVALSSLRNPWLPSAVHRRTYQRCVHKSPAFIEQASEADLQIEHLSRDRDGMYVQEFDQAFKDIGCRVKRTAPQAPNQNAFIER